MQPPPEQLAESALVKLVNAHRNAYLDSHKLIVLHIGNGHLLSKQILIIIKTHSLVDAASHNKTVADAAEEPNDQPNHMHPSTKHALTETTSQPRTHIDGIAVNETE